MVASLPLVYPPLAPRAFEPLPLGAIAPHGWVLEQLVRQATSLSGYLSSTRHLGGFHGDSDVVNKTRWLGGTVMEEGCSWAAELDDESAGGPDRLFEADLRLQGQPS